MTPAQGQAAETGAVDAEEERLRALYRYDVLDTAPEESFDRIARLAKLALQAPIALISLVDRDRQWFKSRQGIEAVETPRSISFCTHAIRDVAPFVVADTLEDPRFRDSPLVTGAPYVRSYIGVPLRTPDGHNIGSLCVKDTKPREVTQEQLNVLADLARLVVDELELRMLVSVDTLTGALTKRAFAREAAREFELARRHVRDLGLIVFDIDHFKNINDRYGHPAGDHVLSRVIGACRSALRTTDVLARIGGDEFAVLLPETRDASREVAEGLCRRIEALDIRHGDATIRVSASFGVTVLADADHDVKSLVARADAAHYRAKSKGRSRVEWVDPGAASSSEAA
jgi:diguanylate cyclase (GGDEF)-like protein